VPTIFHKFNVFSIIESDGSIRPSYTKCNNCDAIHKVVEVGVSIQLAKENTNLLPNIEEIKLIIPENVKKILESYKVDLIAWQEAEFIFENEKWGKHILLFKEEHDDKILGKFLLILGKTLFKIEKFEIEKE
jgi:hypothetical protein